MVAISRPPPFAPPGEFAGWFAGCYFPGRSPIEDIGGQTINAIRQATGPGGARLRNPHRYSEGMTPGIWTRGTEKRCESAPNG